MSTGTDSAPEELQDIFPKEPEEDTGMQIFKQLGAMSTSNSGDKRADDKANAASSDALLKAIMQISM